MESLTFDYFDAWMNAYGRTSTENDPQASADLFAPDAKYYESPFSEPLVGRDAIFNYWNKGAHSFSDKRSGYEVLAVVENRGIARWRAQFSVSATGERIALDCIFLAEFNESGKCALFQEWWHSQVIGSHVAEN